MKRQDRVVNPLWRLAVVLGLGITSMSAMAQQEWAAPAPMGPYGGHFDFGIPAAERGADSAASPQAAYAVYQQQDELPVISASFSQPASETQSVTYNQAELEMIDPAWSLEQEQLGNPQGATGGQADVWALGEIRAEQLPALVTEPETVAAVQSQNSQGSLQPCTVNHPAGQPLLTSSHTPFQEAMLDEFEQTELDMEAMGREADQLAKVEERRDRNWGRAPASIYYPTFMPDYALGVRRANAMDPLALIPQMTSPVQYFGFQQ